MVKGKDKKNKKDYECPCGMMGQSCIVARRKFGDCVHEDTLMEEAGIKKRTHCLSKFTKAQQKVMDAFEKEMKDGGFRSIAYRWEIDGQDSRL